LYRPCGEHAREEALERIIRSLTPAALLVAGVVVFALGTAFALSSDAALSASSTTGSSDLGQAARWLQFLGVACLLGAVCTAGWDAIVRSDWVDGAELAAAALGTLLLTIGEVTFAASNGDSSSATVASAVGIGIWALLALSRAARVSLTEQGPAYGAGNHGAGNHGAGNLGAAAPGGADYGAVPTTGGLGTPVRAPGTSSAVPGLGARAGRADLWLIAAVGLFVLAIGYGLGSAADSTGSAVAADLLQAIGVGLLAWSLVNARARQQLNSQPVPVVIVGLALLALSLVAYGVVAGASFSSLGALGAGLTVATAIYLAGVVALGWAAWTRVRELSVPRARAL
jgi:hypothetical protein